jgi:DNA (cytosine-5)-methyltransferase 1
MARLHGFPDWFRLHATKWHGARQIGNAVPAPLARAIATAVIEGLGTLTQKAEGIIELGEPKLLYFEMSEAAKYFGVERLNGRRDRKSGATKRKQHEIEAAERPLRVLHG